jgi:hypothetical protein
VGGLRGLPHWECRVCSHGVARLDDARIVPAELGISWREFLEFLNTCARPFCARFDVHFMRSLCAKNWMRDSGGLVWFWLTGSLRRLAVVDDTEPGWRPAESFAVMRLEGRDSGRRMRKRRRASGGYIEITDNVDGL